MKRIFSFCISCALCLLVSAQSLSDPKYGIGEVPLIRGHVVFEKTIETVAKNDMQTYETVLAWAKGHFVSPNVNSSKMVGVNYFGQNFTMEIDQDIVFKSKPLSVDKAQMVYKLIVRVRDGKIHVTVTDIVYSYENGSFTADEWITDSESLNRSRTKFLKAAGKFRFKTIDVVYNIEEQIKTLFEN